jgi:ABC-type lipoprotein release transport system permease subunit
MQILVNVILYGFLVYLIYESIVTKDYWYTFVVSFVVLVAVIVSLLPAYHASKVSPGEYPYED